MGLDSRHGRPGRLVGRRRTAIAALMNLLTLAMPLAAAAQGRLAERAVVPDRVEGLSAEQLRALSADLARIATVLRANRTVASLPGPFPCAGIDTRIPEHLSEGARAHVGVTIYDIGDGHLCPGGGGTSVEVHVNTVAPLINAAMGTEGELRDERGQMYRYRPPIGRVGGFSEYSWDGGGTRAVLLTNRPGPLVTPVSQERYLRVLIREWDAKVDAAAAREPEIDGSPYERWLREEKPAAEAEREEYLKEVAAFLTPEQLAEQRALTRAALDEMERGMREMAARSPDLAANEREGLRKIEAMTGDIRDMLQAELDALSPSQRAAPACIGSSEPGVSNLVDCTEGKTRIVNLNPNFFDDSLPQSVIQVLVVTTAGSRHMMESRERFEIKARIFETLDYAALAEVLH